MPLYAALTVTWQSPVFISRFLGVQYRPTTCHTLISNSSCFKWHIIKSAELVTWPDTSHKNTIELLQKLACQDNFLNRHSPILIMSAARSFKLSRVFSGIFHVAPHNHPFKKLQVAVFAVYCEHFGRAWSPICNGHKVGLRHVGCFYHFTGQKSCKCTRESVGTGHSR